MARKRVCGRCGRDIPEMGPYGSVWTQKTGEVFYCHPDDEDDMTCYMLADQQLARSQ